MDKLNLLLFLKGLKGIGNSAINKHFANAIHDNVSIEEIRDKKVISFYDLSPSEIARLEEIGKHDGTPEITISPYMVDNKIIDYIDEVVEDSNKAGSSYLISQLNNFPDGGIKGLLYYKLSIMEDENINYTINASFKQDTCHFYLQILKKKRRVINLL